MTADHPRLGKLSIVRRRLGGLVLWVSAVDRDVLAACPAIERAQFIALGMAIMAGVALSIWLVVFTLQSVSSLPLVLVMAFALVWGAIKLGVDRFVVSAGPVRIGWRRFAIVILPRLLLAVLSGVVLATLLILAIYQSKIEQQLVETQQRRLARVHQQSAIDSRFIIIPALAEIVRLQAEYSRLDREYTEASLRALCELDGTCGTLQPGKGAKYLELQQSADRLRAQRDDVGQQLSAAQLKVPADLAVNAEGELARLKALRQEEVDRATAIDRGLLARLAALNELSDRNPAARTSVISLTALLVAFDALPTLLLLAMGLGPPTLYARLLALTYDSERQRSELEQVIKQRRDEIQTMVRNALEPAPPVGFQGRVTATADGARVVGPGVWAVTVGASCNMTVTVVTGSDAYSDAVPTEAGAVSRQIAVQSSRSGETVDVEIDVDAPFVEVTEANWTAELRTSRDERSYRTTLSASRVGEYDVRVCVYSAGRLIQALPVTLGVRAVDATEPVGGEGAGKYTTTTIVDDHN